MPLPFLKSHFTEILHCAHISVLSRCIESVLAQTYSDYELILVDDGSPDGCPLICDEYAKKDERIKVIHKKNGGLVSARQAGIKIATGDYIFNLDGDDAILPDALESAYNILQDTNTDIVSFCYKTWIDGVVGDVVEDLAEEGLYNKAAMEKSLYPNLVDQKFLRLVNGDNVLIVSGISELTIKYQNVRYII